MPALVHPDPLEDAMAADYEPEPLALARSIPTVPHGYAPPPGRRLFAFVGTSFIFALAGAGLLLSFEGGTSPPRPSAPPVVTLLPLASPPVTPPKPRQAPRPVEMHERRPMPPKVEPIEHSIVPLPTISPPPPSPTAGATDPAPPQPETAAPRTSPAPLAPQVSSSASDTWEGRVLARLQKVQRYPGAARAAHQQGVVYVRFRMNRDGHVLSSVLARGSGFPALDQAALETLRRADPLPKIPPDKPDEIDLSVPVEFFLSGR